MSKSTPVSSYENHLPPRIRAQRGGAPVIDPVAGFDINLEAVYARALAHQDDLRWLQSDAKRRVAAAEGLIHAYEALQAAARFYAAVTSAPRREVPVLPFEESLAVLMGVRRD